MPSISILVHDLSSPILGWATETASLLSRHYPVQVVGPDFGHGICPMYRGAFGYTAVEAKRLYRLPDYWWERRRLANAITGELIFAFKAYADTVPVALGLKKKRAARVIVCLDEWDGALYHRLSSRGKWRSFRRHWHHPLQELYHPWVERQIRHADDVVSTTSALQRRFGGRIIPMGADTDRFAPQPDDVVQQRKENLGLAGLNLVVFGGVVRPHKGVDQLADALVRLGREDVKLAVIGPQTEHLTEICRHVDRGRYVIALGSHPKSAMPDYLSVADVVALPQVDNLLAKTQMPCKVFEAMAMAKPVIASDVSDLSDVLQGCGKVVPPGDVNALAEAIEWILDHPEQARAMGKAARRRCLEKYSRSASEAGYLRLIHDLGFDSTGP